MSEFYNEQPKQDTPPVRESFLGGLLGALAATVVLGAVYMLVTHITGSIFWAAGLVIAMGICLAYDRCRGTRGFIRIFIVVVCTVLALFLGYVADLVWTVSNQIPGREIGQYLQIIQREFASNSEFHGGVVQDLAISLGTGLIGAIIFAVSNLTDPQRKKVSK